MIWPAYFDKGNSRSGGRVIPRKISVTSPELKEIVQAAKDLGLNPVVEQDKAYPKSWWKVSGRVLVDKKGVKSGIVREIARKIGETRGK